MGTPRVILIIFLSTCIASQSSCTLLKPCDGENLQDCVKGAEHILLDTKMTFPDDNETLQTVCGMWDEMTRCAYNYTARCLTSKENHEFHQYFQQPMSSMKRICTDQESTKEYFQHAHCIKTISTVDQFCGQQYQFMIGQILSVTVNTMRKICCALSDFKDCVVQKDADHACGDGPDHDHETDGDISSYALKTLEKSLLAFVAHSCTKEGFNRATCNDQVVHIGASNDLEAIVAQTEKPVKHSIDSESQQVDIEPIPSSFGGTQKTLLVPMTSSTMEPDDLRSSRKPIQVNVSSSGEKGKMLEKIKGRERENIVNAKTDNVLNAKTTNTVNAKTANTVNAKSEKQRGDISISVDQNELQHEILEAKIRNVSLLWSQTTGKNNVDPVAEKRIDTNVLHSGSGVGGNRSTSSRGQFKAAGGSRAGSARSLNLVNSLEEQEDQEGQRKEMKLQGDMPSSNGHVNNTNATFTSPSALPSPLVTSTTLISEATGVASTSNESPSTSVLERTVETTEATAGVSGNARGSYPPGVIMTTNAPKTTQTSPSTVGVTTTTKGGTTVRIPQSGTNNPQKKKMAAGTYNATRPGLLTKNTSHVSVSDVPVRVFLIWLSTFFV